jgi:hypothetical protein
MLAMVDAVELLYTMKQRLISLFGILEIGLGNCGAAMSYAV